jgi:1-acyl-sn-glycerol-3-phosphate acyltransferase
VLKDLLQLDPAIDVLLNRVGASFVPSGGRGGDAVVAEIARLAQTATARDALVIFPEGGNFTPERRQRAIDKLNTIGRPDLAVRAERLTHLLPPKPLGVLTAIEHAPGATVVFVGHVGLEALSTARDIWRNLPMDHTITARTWRVEPEAIPPHDEREHWLYERWEAIDDWIDASLVEEGEAVDGAA